MILDININLMYIFGMIKVIYLNKKKFMKLFEIIRRKIYLKKEKNILIVQPSIYKKLIKNYGNIYYDENKKNLYVEINNNNLFTLNNGDLLIVYKEKIKKIYTFA